MGCAVIHVTHSIGDLAADMARIANNPKTRMPSVVTKNAVALEAKWKELALASAGIHGLNFYKRINSEPLSSFSWEVGPTAPKGGQYVGVGYRNAPPNRDRENAADSQGPLFAKDVRDEAASWFW